MSNFDSDGGPDSEWEDRGDLAWNEFDWERYLREQDDAIDRYLRFYESSTRAPDRLDVVAEKMNWNQDDWTDDGETDDDDDDSDEDDDFDNPQDVYTLHKNPIFIATKAIYLGLNRSWQALASGGEVIPLPTAVALQSSLHAGEDHAVQAIHALDFGDYAMAVSLFKRALSALNGTFALLGADGMALSEGAQNWREDAMSRLFDLREIWLRVMSECRDELERPLDDE